MIDTFELYLSFQSTVNSFQGGWFRPQTDFIRKCNDISKRLWNKWTREAEKSQEAKDNLFPFFKSKNYIVNNRGIYGMFSADKDYGRFAAARIIVNKKEQFLPDSQVGWGDLCKEASDKFKSQDETTDEYYDGVRQFDVDMIDDIKWGAVNKHKTKTPTVESPKMRQVNGQFEVAPRKVSVIVLDYYREPKDATFLYTLAPGDVQTGAGDQIIYNKESQPLEWPFNVRDEFLIGLGEAYGIFTRDQFLTQVNMTKKTA